MWKGAVQLGRIGGIWGAKKVHFSSSCSLVTGRRAFPQCKAPGLGGCHAKRHLTAVTRARMGHVFREHMQTELTFYRGVVWVRGAQSRESKECCFKFHICQELGFVCKGLTTDSPSTAVYNNDSTRQRERKELDVKYKLHPAITETVLKGEQESATAKCRDKHVEGRGMLPKPTRTNSLISKF